MFLLLFRPDGHFYFFNTAAVGVEDGEFEIPGLDGVVDLGDIPGQFEDEAGQAIAFTLYRIEGIDGDVHGLADIMEHGPAFEYEAAVFEAAVGGLFFVELIADIADDLFEDIFEGDDAAGAAEFVDDYGKVDLFLLEFLQEVFDEFMLMNEIDGSKEAMPVEIIGLGEVGDEVPGMDHAGEF